MKNKPWLNYNITKSTYYRHKEQGDLEDYLEMLKTKGYRRNTHGRYSKRVYSNSEDYINQIKEKYKNGVTTEIMKEFEMNLSRSIYEFV